MKVKKLTSETLIVSKNTDGPEEGTLRHALEQTQKGDVKHPSDIKTYYIEFEIPENAKPTNNVRTGYFTIELNSPLPAIYKNFVYINTLSPNQVILVPKGKAVPPTNPGTPDMKIPMGVLNGITDPATQENNASGSYFYIGDPNTLSPEMKKNPEFKINNDAWHFVHINAVNFVRNKAQGQAGQKGAGGGLGAGGGITLTAGNLRITNSIFQNIQANGGKGGAPAAGGEKNKYGQFGGSSVHSSIPVRISDSGQLSYTFDFGLPANGGIAGYRGTPGTCYHQWDRAIGGNGGNGTPELIRFGFGGPGGGGGGGGNWYWAQQCQQGIQKYQPGGTGGEGAIGNHGGGKGGKGQTGGGSNGAPSGGSAGADGDAHGGAIAVMSQLGNRNTTLVLDKVGFFQTDANGNAVSGKIIDNTYGEGVNESKILIGDIRYGKDRQTAETPTIKELKPDLFAGYNYSEYDEKLPDWNKDDVAPFRNALSQPRNKYMADVFDEIIEGETDISESFIVHVESGSTIAGITADLTDPNNPLNDIWRKLVPDNKDKIIQEYEAKKNASFWNALFKPEYLIDLSIAYLSQSMGSWKKNKKESLGNSLIYSAIIKDLYSFFGSQSAIANNLEKALKQNEKEQEQLGEYLKQASEKTIGSIDLKLDRSMAIIDNFEVGKDTLNIPQPKGCSMITDIGKITYNNESKKGLLFKFANCDADGNYFLGLILNKNSEQEIGKDLQGYITDLVEMTDESYLIGRQPKNISYVYGLEGNGGPASEHIIIDRERDPIPEDKIITIQSKSGDDYIVGSNGIEDILSGRDDDIIVPLLGNDDINGQSGLDLVSYNSLEQPVEINTNDNGKVEAIIEAIHQDEEHFYTQKLENIESFELWGDSKIDLSNYKISDPEYKISVKTGAGSDVKGSKFDDSIFLSYFDEFNQIQGEEKKDLTQTETIINGNDGYNTLAVDFSVFKDDIPVKEYDPSERTLIFSINEKTILKASNIDRVNFVGTEDDDGWNYKQTKNYFGISEPLRSNRELKFNHSKKKANTGLHELEVVYSMDKGDDFYQVNHGNSKIYGDKGDDTIVGSVYFDLLDGGKNDDYLYAKGKKDLLIGGKGDDILTVNGNNHTLMGGSGNDVINLSSGSKNYIFLLKGDDTINGFNAKKDTIILPKSKAKKIHIVSNKVDLEKALEDKTRKIILSNDTLYYNYNKKTNYREVNFQSLNGKLTSADIWTQSIERNSFISLLQTNNELNDYITT